MKENKEATKCQSCKGTTHMCKQCLYLIEQKLKAKQTKLKRKALSVFTLQTFWLWVR